MATRSCLYVFLLLLLASQSISTKANNLPPPLCRTVVASTLNRFEFLANWIVLLGQFFLRSSVNLGINDISPGLVEGPITTGASVAVLDDSNRRMIEEFGLAAVAHLRAIVAITPLNAPLRSPQLNLSSPAFNSVLFSNLTIDIYTSQTGFLLAAELTTSMIKQYLTYIGPLFIGNDNQQLLAGMLATMAAQNGAIRSLLSAGFNRTVPLPPSININVTVADLTGISAENRNLLGLCGVKDEGLVVPVTLGAENRTTSNVVAADVFSLGFGRTEREMSRITYATSNATRPGALFPEGCVGSICRGHITLRLN